MISQNVQHAQALVEQWRGEFVAAMQAMGDTCPEMTVELVEPTGGDGTLWWNQPMDVAVGSEVWIGAAEEAWSALGRTILIAAGVESFSPAELRDAYLEVLRQSFGSLARKVGGGLGRDITATAGAVGEPGTNAAFGCQIAIKIADQELPHLAFYASHQMVEALATTLRPEATPASDTVVDDKDPGTELSTRACGNLDLLLDVEMPVSVSFGHTRVRVQDILRLVSGSVIELDRAISEPVEVIVNNCTIARGEVVVVDGNYGVRINEVMSRKERLQESRKYLLPAISGRH